VSVHCLKAFAAQQGFSVLTYFGGAMFAIVNFTNPRISKVPHWFLHLHKKVLHLFRF
jgi:hypothetical protein